MQTTKDVFLGCDAAGVITTMNKPAEALLGPRLGRPLAELFLPAVGATLDANSKEAGCSRRLYLVEGRKSHKVLPCPLPALGHFWS